MVGQEHKVERRLAAILAADVVGSTRLMEQDEVGTLAIINAVLTEVIGPAVTRHKGRIVKTLGDGALIEFASPVEAVLCAVETQTAVTERANLHPEWSAVQLRIGVNLGDTIIGANGDIHGDSVNIAVRLEGVADPGGVCISGKVYEELEGKLALPFEDRGEQCLKNIARPIRVYALKGGETTSREPHAARPSPNRADRPSIAVLPFVNLSGDPEQEYLAEGIADDILTALAKARWLFVMARSSSFAFKGKAIETDQIARRLGVRYILSGSLRRSGTRIRISAHLVEAETGGSIWSERYDRDHTDIFDLQDEITEAVAGAIEPELLKKEGQRAAERPQSSTAWDLVRRGVWEFQKVGAESHRAARKLLLDAIKSDPNFAEGYIWLARAECGLAAYGWIENPDVHLREAISAGLKAVQLDGKNPYSHYAVAISHMFAGKCDVAVRAAQRALVLSPSFALGHLVLGGAYLHQGLPEMAIEPLEHGLRLSPFDPQNFSWLVFLAAAYYLTSRPEEGLANARRALTIRPGWAAALKVVALCAHALGDDVEARKAVEEMDSASLAGADITRTLSVLNSSWASETNAAIEQIKRAST